MNYFRGNGVCGLSIAPKYVKEATNDVIDQSIFNEPSVSVNEDLIRQNNYTYSRLYQYTD